MLLIGTLQWNGSSANVSKLCISHNGSTSGQIIDLLKYTMYPCKKAAATAMFRIGGRLECVFMSTQNVLRKCFCDMFVILHMWLIRDRGKGIEGDTWWP